MYLAIIFVLVISATTKSMKIRKKTGGIDEEYVGTNRTGREHRPDVRGQAVHPVCIFLKRGVSFLLKELIWDWLLISI